MGQEFFFFFFNSRCFLKNFELSLNTIHTPCPKSCSTHHGARSFCLFNSSFIFLKVSFPTQPKKIRPHAPDPGDTPHGAWSCFEQSTCLSIYQFVSLPIYPAIYLSMYLSVCLPVSLPPYLFYLSADASIHRSVYLFICHSAFYLISLLYVPAIYQSHRFIHRSTSQSVCTCSQ